MRQTTQAKKYQCFIRSHRRQKEVWNSVTPFTHLSSKWLLLKNQSERKLTLERPTLHYRAQSVGKDTELTNKFSSCELV